MVGVTDDDLVPNTSFLAGVDQWEEINRAVRPLGWWRERWYGVRVFTDHCDEPAPPADELADLLAAEYEAGARDPYRQVAAIQHLVYSRGAR